MERQNEYSKLTNELSRLITNNTIVYQYEDVHPDKKVFYLNDGDSFTKSAFTNLTQLIHMYGKNAYLCYKSKIFDLQIKLVNDAQCDMSIDYTDIVLSFYKEDNYFKIVSKKDENKGIKMRELVTAIAKKFNAIPGN